MASELGEAAFRSSTPSVWRRQREEPRASPAFPPIRFCGDNIHYFRRPLPNVKSPKPSFLRTNLHSYRISSALPSPLIVALSRVTVPCEDPFTITESLTSVDL